MVGMEHKYFIVNYIEEIIAKYEEVKEYLIH